MLLAATPAPSPTAPVITSTVVPTPVPTTTVTGTPAGHADLILWLVVAGVIAAGIVIVIGRKVLTSDQNDPAASVIRSWIAVALIIGLLIFCAATLLGSNTSLQSTLFGGLIASTGAAIAFYFSSKAADQARADILNAASTLGQGVTKPSVFAQISPPDGKVNTTYKYVFKSDGVPTPTYGLVSGELPAGLTLDTDGTLHGTPKLPSPAPPVPTFVIAAANPGGFLVSPELTIIISPG
jgi:hypothetical protein